MSPYFRYCKKCGKKFYPTGKATRLCALCWLESSKRVRKKKKGCGKFLRTSFDCGDVLNGRLYLCQKCEEVGK